MSERIFFGICCSLEEPINFGNIGSIATEVLVFGFISFDN